MVAQIDAMLVLAEVRLDTRVVLDLVKLDTAEKSASVAVARFGSASAVLLQNSLETLAMATASSMAALAASLDPKPA